MSDQHSIQPDKTTARKISPNYMQEHAYIFAWIHLRIHLPRCKYTTYLLHCKWQRACPAFLCPESGSAAPGWKDRTGRPSPFFHLSPCLFLCLALSPVHRSVAAGAEPRAGVPWQSQQQPDNGEQRETRSIRWLQIKISLFKTLSEV